MDDRIRLDGLILFICVGFTETFDNDPHRKSGTFATNHIA